MANEYKSQVAIEVIKQGTGAQQAGQELQQLQGQAEKTGAAGANMGASWKTFYGVIAAGLTAGVVREAIREANEAEKANIGLSTALKNAGQASAEYRAELDRQAQAIADLAAVDDDAVRGVQARLISFGAQRQEMERLTKAVLDLSEAGYGLEQSAQAVGAAVSGEMAPLTRLLKTDVPDGLPRMEQLAILLQTIEGRFAGMAEAQARAGGGMRQLSVATGQLKEDFGRMLSGGLEPVVRELTSAAKATHEWAADTDKSKPIIVGGMTAIGVTVAGLTAGYAALTAQAIAARIAMAAATPSGGKAGVGGVGGALGQGVAGGFAARFATTAWEGAKKSLTAAGGLASIGSAAIVTAPPAIIPSAARRAPASPARLDASIIASLDGPALPMIAGIPAMLTLLVRDRTARVSAPASPATTLNCGK